MIRALTFENEAGGAAVFVAGVVGVGMAWGLMRLLREREHSVFRLKELGTLPQKSVP
jgi:hypothetical protein